MKIKTASDIKTSLKVFRDQRMICRTNLTEDQIIQDLETEYGEICIPPRDMDSILDKEKKQVKRAKISQRSLLKTFQQRKKARLIQHVVENRNKKSTDVNPGHYQGRAQSSILGIDYSYPEESEREVVINEIELEY